MGCDFDRITIKETVDKDHVQSKAYKFFCNNLDPSRDVIFFVNGSGLKHLKYFVVNSQAIVDVPQFLFGRIQPWYEDAQDKKFKHPLNEGQNEIIFRAKDNLNPDAKANIHEILFIYSTNGHKTESIDLSDVAKSLSSEQAQSSLQKGGNDLRKFK